MLNVATDDVGCTISAAPGESLSECDTEQARSLLRTQGWVYFTGFEPTLEEFRIFTAGFGRCATPRSIEYPPGGVALGFHAEDAYNPWRPDALWFLCLNAGSDRGAPTGVVDGVGLLEALPPEWREYSLEGTLRFNRSWPVEQWSPLTTDGDAAELTAFLNTLPGLTHEFGADRRLHIRYATPMVVTTQDGRRSLSNTALHAVTDHEYYGMTLATGELVNEDYLAVVEKTALEREIPLGWSAGDMVVIDNYRLMHRRGEYHGVGRELRVVHGEEFFGTPLPVATTASTQALKEALQGEEDLR